NLNFCADIVLNKDVNYLKEELDLSEINKDKIAVLGFHPYKLVYEKETYKQRSVRRLSDGRKVSSSYQKARTKLVENQFGLKYDEQLNLVSEIGTPIDKIDFQGYRDDLHGEKVENVYRIILENTNNLGYEIINQLIDLKDFKKEYIFNGKLIGTLYEKDKVEENIHGLKRVKNRNVKYYILGFNKPVFKKMSSNTQLSLFAFVFTLGIFPAVIDGEENLNLYILDENLNIVFNKDYKVNRTVLSSWTFNIYKKIFGGEREYKKVLIKLVEDEIKVDLKNKLK
ncbi:MAG: hypothetical protein KDK36_02840, partial [Leptospiraceae bacterium]|nr:hypothetical protein [Leptospiraceae bacterium]